jgi:hypothetical protein
MDHFVLSKTKMTARASTILSDFPLISLVSVLGSVFFPLEFRLPRFAGLDDFITAE